MFLSRRVSQTLLLLFFALVTSGCATILEDIIDDSVPVEHHFTVNKFILPESNGKFLSGKAQLYTAGTGTVTLIDDIDSTTYSTTPSIRSTNELGGLLDLGLLSRVDLVYSTSLGVRVQLLGESRQSAKKGNTSLSLVYLSRSYDSETTSEDTTGSVKKAEAETKNSGHEYIVVVGHRTTEKTVLYGSAFYAESSTRVHLYQTNNTNFTSSGYPTKGEGTAVGANLGIFYEVPKAYFDALGWSVGAEIGYAKIEWEKTLAPKETPEDQSGLFGGATIGLTW